MVIHRTITLKSKYLDTTGSYHQRSNKAIIKTNRPFLQNTMLMANFHAVKHLGRRQTVSSLLWRKSVPVFNYVSCHECVYNSYILVHDTAWTSAARFTLRQFYPRGRSLLGPNGYEAPYASEPTWNRTRIHSLYWATPAPLTILQRGKRQQSVPELKIPAHTNS